MKVARIGDVMSWKLDDDVAATFSKRYSRLCARYIRLCNPRHPSKSEYAQHILLRVMRNIENNLFIAGNVKRILNVLDEPTDSELARVLFHCGLDPAWAGWVNMNAYKRFMKRRRLLVRGLEPMRRVRRLKSKAPISSAIASH